MKSIEKYKLAMLPIPEDMEIVLQKPIQAGVFPSIENAQQVFSQWDKFANRVIRSDSGLVMVTCTTDMPKVTPQMIDWWFGWHLPSSERYQLWHPNAHVKASVRHDRSALAGNREKYIGNVSSVDEYIGKQMMRLNIAFFDPNEIGMGHVYDSEGTAICARTSDRVLRGDGGLLIHWVRKTGRGSEMLSVFWLGELNLRWPILGPLLKPLLNTSLVRNFFVSNQMTKDLQRHCVEEMNHLARFLPALYAEVNGE